MTGINGMVLDGRTGRVGRDYTIVVCVDGEDFKKLGIDPKGTGLTKVTIKLRND